MAGRFKGCSRGIFGLQSWEPLRKPGQKLEPGPVAGVEPRSGKQSVPAQKQGAPDRKPTDPRIGRDMKAKYSYTANPDSPIGEELSCKQLETLTFVLQCPDNEHWWVACNASGVEGYVPARYMQLEEDVPTGLPWLQNKELLENKDKRNEPTVPAEKLTYTSYKSAYKSAYDTSGEKKDSNFRCDMCDKTLNGPQPYRMHMASKAHKEMLEYTANGVYN